MSATIAADKRETITQGLKKDVLEYSPTWNEWKPYINPRNAAHHELKDKTGAIVGTCQFPKCTACKNKEAIPEARPAATPMVETAPGREAKNAEQPFITAATPEPERAKPAPMQTVAGEALAVTDADGRALEAKFAGVSKPFTYRDTETNTVKRARQEKHAPTVIALTADVADAELIPEPTPGPQAQAAPTEPATETADVPLEPKPAWYEVSAAQRAIWYEEIVKTFTDNPPTLEEMNTAWEALEHEQLVVAFADNPPTLEEMNAAWRTAWYDELFKVFHNPPEPPLPAAPGTPGKDKAAQRPMIEHEELEALPMNAEPATGTLGKKEAAQVPLQGLDALRYYTERGIKLIPCIPTDETRKRYKPIVKKEHFSRTATADIGTIEKYMKGGELWTGYDTATGYDLHEPVTLFRFTPKDYGLVCIDIDRGHSNGEDGAQNFYDWLEAAGITKPQLPSYLRDIEKYPCRTLTPNGGLHLYFKAAEPNTRATLDELDSAGKLAKDIAGKEHGVEVFYSNPITAAGSRKGDGEYFLRGAFNAAFEYPLILLRRSQKTEKPKQPEPAPVKPRRNAGYPQSNTQTTDLNRYRPRLVEYLHAKGITEDADGFISCLCHEDGESPNMKVNTDYLYCFSCNERLDIFDVARILAGIGTDNKDFPKVIKEVQETIGG